MDIGVVTWREEGAGRDHGVEDYGVGVEPAKIFESAGGGRRVLDGIRGIQREHIKYNVYRYNQTDTLRRSPFARSRVGKTSSEDMTQNLKRDEQKVDSQEPLNPLMIWLLHLL